MKMAKKKRTAVLAAAAAFAASPQGRKLLNQAKEYAMRPENQQRARELAAKARTKLKSGKPGTTPTTPASSSYVTEPPAYPRSNGG
jgi:hypothetical protein